MEKNLSFECVPLDVHNKTYVNIHFNFDGFSFELLNDQKSLEFYNDLEDVAFLI